MKIVLCNERLFEDRHLKLAKRDGYYKKKTIYLTILIDSSLLIENYKDMNFFYVRTFFVQLVVDCFSNCKENKREIMSYIPPALMVAFKFRNCF